MQPGPIIGVLVALFCILVGNFLEGGHAGSMVGGPAALIVIGGTIGAVLVQYPVSTCIAGCKAALATFKKPDEDAEKLVEEIADYAQRARRDGILALEKVAETASDPFLRKALTMAVDGVDSQSLRDTLEVAISQEEEHGEDAAKALETLVPMDVIDLGINKQRYAFFTNSSGGILDDLMITRRPGDLFLIVNAGCKAADIAHLVTNISHRCTVQPLPDRALLALQGPKAAQALATLNPDVAKLTFMTGMSAKLAGIECFLTRSGYTGEDGYEISAPSDQADALARAILACPGVKPAGLGARDTLRLEAGMNLYGLDMDESKHPLQSGLAWTVAWIPEDRDFIGRQAIEERRAKPDKTLVGLVLDGRGVMRSHMNVRFGNGAAGETTSGGFAPTMKQSIALARVDAVHAGACEVEIRGQWIAARIVKPPFVRNGKVLV